jgi:hypothetical protein
MCIFAVSKETEKKGSRETSKVSNAKRVKERVSGKGQREKRRGQRGNMWEARGEVQMRE